MPGKPRSSRRLNIIKTEQKSFEEPPSDEEPNKRVPAKRTNSRRMSTIKAETKPVNPSSDEEFEVEKILDKRVVSGKVCIYIIYLLNQYFQEKELK